MPKAIPHATTDTASTRDRLLACARDIYLGEGLVGLSMRKVAQMAGVSATAIYRHFDSKEALLAAVAEEGFALFAEYLWRGLQADTPRERLRATGTGYLRFALEQSPYYRVIFLSPADALGFTQMPETVGRKAAPTFQFLVDRVRECIEAGVLVEAEPAELAATIWAHSHGLVALYLNGNLRIRLATEAEFEDFYQRSQDRLVRGLAP
jgi:AcrR family transcriptional regulator